MRIRNILTCLIGPLAFASSISAAPYIPKSSEEIICHLPATELHRGIRSLKRQLINEETNLVVTLDLVRSYLALNQITGQNQYLAFAELNLKRIENSIANTTEVHLLQALLDQRNHHFAKSIERLDLVLAKSPKNIQALLTKASVLQLLGDYEGARIANASLFGLGLSKVGLISTANLAAVAGKAEKSYELLTSLVSTNAAPKDTETSWALLSMAELTARIGKLEESDAFYKAALRSPVPDQYLLLSYADFLIHHRRSADAGFLAMLRPLGTHLPFVQLRLLEFDLAQQQTAEWKARAGKLKQDLFDEEDDVVHWRERARFLLRIRNQPDAALREALKNWETQKEPMDALLVLESAVASKKNQKAEAVMDWISRHRWSDPLLQRLIQIGQLSDRKNEESSK